MKMIVILFSCFVNTGKIEPSEVQMALTKLGVSIDIAEAERLTRQMDKDGSLTLDWDEWRNFFELYPSESLEDMIMYWRQSLVRATGL